MADTRSSRYARSTYAALSWAWRELALALPAGLGRLGRRSAGTLTGLGADNTPGVSGGVRQSLLGVWNHQSRPGGGVSILTLEPSRVLRRTLPLSKLASRNPGEAARLASLTLNPLPPEESLLAIEPVGEAEVELAIARKADIDAAVGEASKSGGAWFVCADFDGHGPRFVFAQSPARHMAHPWAMIGLAAAALLLALITYQDRLSRDIVALESARTAALQEVQTRRAALVETADTQAGSHHSDLGQALLALEHAEISVGDVDRIRLIQGEWLIEGEGGVERISMTAAPEVRP